MAVVVAVDQGTTGSTVLVMDRAGRVVGRAYKEFTQYFPKPGWVEHDAEEIWQVTLGVLRQACRKAKVRGRDVAAIGITNQRETVVLWDRRTGKPVHRAIVWQDRRTAEYCDSLKGRGYETYLAGKWHLNGGLDVKGHTQPRDHGFDHALAFHAFAIPSHRNPENFFLDGKPLGRLEGYAAQIVVDQAASWLEARSREAPFFLYLAFAEPHGTIASPEFFTDLYSAFTRGRPEPFANGGTIPANLAARGPGEYYANVTHMDFQIGRLLERLDRLGLRDDTIVVFTSDNGPVTEDWRHWYEVNLYGSTGGLRGRKADLYDGGIRVPAIVRWPGHVAPGTETAAPVIGYDLLPTLVALAGASVPADRPIDGEDVSALLRGEAFRRQRPLFWEFEDDQGFHYALRDGDWKLITDRAFERRRLYDLARDRFEVEDQTAQQPAAATALLERLKELARGVAADPLRPR